MQSHSFQDFDAFAASVRDIDAVMMLQNPARRLWSINHVNVDGIDVQMGQLGSGNIVEGQSWGHGVLIYLPLSQSVEYSANGKVLDRHEFMVLEPSCEFCVSTRVAHDWCSIFVPTGRLVRNGGPPEPSLVPSVSDTPRCRVARANRQVTTRFWSIVNQIKAASANSSRFESSPAAKSAASELANVASLVLGRVPAGEPDQTGRPRLSRSEIIRCCQELIEARASEPMRMEALIARAGVSERTLRQAFRDYYGVGLVRYLQLRQLHQVDRALRRADPETTRVGDVLVEHGVWELSRFAARYRRLFGKLPSQTLRNKA